MSRERIFIAVITLVSIAIIGLECWCQGGSL
jgi:hypothetical protein